MADFPGPTLVGRQASVVTTYSLLGTQIVIGAASINSRSGQTWPTANLAIFVPWVVHQPFTVAFMGLCNGGVASGNSDVGIYDAEGNRIVSKGSTAQAGTTAWQTFDITDTTLNPGLYYLAAAMDNTTGSINGPAPNAPYARALGVRQMATAFPLPATATFAAYTGTKIPDIMATAQTVV